MIHKHRVDDTPEEHSEEMQLYCLEEKMIWKTHYIHIINIVVQGPGVSDECGGCRERRCAHALQWPSAADPQHPQVQGTRATRQGALLSVLLSLPGHLPQVISSNGNSLFLIYIHSAHVMRMCRGL